MVVFFTALLLVSLFLAFVCHQQGSSAFFRMTVARTEDDSQAFEAEWKRWRQLQFHISLGIVVLICGLGQIL